MPAIFSKNCILTGDLDSYCLACSAHLPGEDNVLAHIQDSKHKANLKPVVYFDKYKDDFIKKVNGIYFCELCNKTFSTAAKVGVHVTEETHMKSRTRQLKRVGTSIIFQKNTLIEEGSWNGLVDDTCVICNVEFEDISIHSAEPTHILNVVRSTVTIDDKNNIYRKVDGGYHCLTCNIIVSDNLIAEHLNSLHHNAAADTQNDLSPNTDGDTLQTKSVLNENKAKSPSSNGVTKEVETLAKQYGLSVQNDKSTVYCKACNLEVPATLNCVKQHIHKNNKKITLNLSETKKQSTHKIERVNLETFITNFVHIECGDGEEYVIINQTFCLRITEYLGLSKFGNIARCQFCQKNLDYENPMMAVMHMMSHGSNMCNDFVITSLEDEFVRQVKDFYHCGYCGTAESDFDRLLDHLTTVQHKMHKAQNKSMLQRFKTVEMLNRMAHDVNPFTFRF